MPGNKIIKKYQEEKENQVLAAVKKYPLYSLDKLKKELPDISRHSIQNILEDKHLSTVADRLNFANKKDINPIEEANVQVINSPVIEKIEGNKTIKFSLPNPLTKISLLPRRAVKISLALIFIAIIFWQGIAFVFAQTPAITIDQPTESFRNEGQKLFVRGKVTPSASKVTVNGTVLALNGDGSFTGTVDIPMGQSILKFEANYHFKKAQFVRIINRVLTKEEIEAQSLEEAKKKEQVIDKVAELDRGVNDILAAKTANKGQVKIINNHVKTEGGFSSVVGEVTNLGQKDVSWVMITANFYNQNGAIVDTKYGFATGFGEVIKPQGTAKFETQATNKIFDYYNLSVGWEEGAVAGVSTGATEATPSTKASPTPKPTPSPTSAAGLQ